MPFGWRRRQPPEQDAAAEKVDAQRVRKRDLLRQLLSGLSREPRQPRAASIPSIVEPERKSRIPESLRTLKKHYRSRSFVKSADDDRSAAAPSASDIQVTQHVENEELDDAKSEAPAEDASTHDPRELTEEDIPNLFAGAPLFSVDKVKGRRIPRVDFPYDDTLIVRDVSDSPQLSHEAFSAATLRPHLCQVGHQDEKRGIPMGYDINVVEVPSMLSEQGTELGTVGFDHFLEIPRSDHLRLEDNDDESIMNRELLEETPEKLGIKWLDQRLIYERLMELSQVHQNFKESAGKQTILDVQSPGEMYAHLFGKFLMPPRFDGSTSDPTGLKVQIETLIRILKLKGIWHDFSLVEWRIRFGRILWDSDVPDSDEEQYGGPGERDMLLLQILLASELLLRLDAISGLPVKEVTGGLQLTESEVRNFASMKTRKTDWDLVLARRFLENIEISEETPAPLTPKRRGFLAALNVGRAVEEEEEPQETEFWLRPRYRERQLSGLLHFAEAIGWPHLKEFSIHLTAKLQDTSTPPSPSVYGTPLASPLATPRVSKDPGGYFDDAFRRPRASRTNTQRSIQLQPSATSGPSTPQRPSLLRRDSSQPTNGSGGPADIGGWLSRTFLTGLVLPGEAISHFLISTLLENDKAAVTALGESANLYGGFIYAGRSWWSKSCVVGRVLAALDGAKECMGWISVPYIPDGFENSWVDIVNGTAPPSPGKKSKARIDCGEKIERDSTYLAGKEDAEVTGDDLTLPKDTVAPPEKIARLSKLDLIPEHLLEVPESDAETDVVEPQPSYSAQLIFDLPDTSVTLSLTYDIQFITAWPCTPPSSATNKKLRRLNRNSTQGRTGPVSAHPLHVAHKYRVITPAQLLAGSPHLTPTSSSISLLDETAASGEVLVIDARPPRNSVNSASALRAPKNGEFAGPSGSGGSDAALMARAWCADRGEHALVGRVGRTCLACCVREARALGVRIVIRV